MVWLLDMLTVHMYGCLFGTEVKHGVAVRYRSKIDCKGKLRTIFEVRQVVVKN